MIVWIKVNHKCERKRPFFDIDVKESIKTLSHGLLWYTLRLQEPQKLVVLDCASAKVSKHFGILGGKVWISY